MVSQFVEDMPRELMIADIKEQASSPTNGKPHAVSYATNAKHMV
jgi:hypothetical protein